MRWVAAVGRASVRRTGLGQRSRRWTLAGGYPSVRVTDTEERCPACDAMDWDQYTPFAEWRGGRGSKVDGTNIPNPVLSCRVCGHEERAGARDEADPQQRRERVGVPLNRQLLSANEVDERFSRKASSREAALRV